MRGGWEGDGCDRGPGTRNRGPGESGEIRDYRDLRVWQRAMELVLASYSLAGAGNTHSDCTTFELHQYGAGGAPPDGAREIGRKLGALIARLRKKKEKE